MEGVFNMTKSIIELELEKCKEICACGSSGHGGGFLDKSQVNSSIQKALEELMKDRYCNSTIAFHICDKNPDDCNFIVEWLDIEKCFGVGK